MSMDKEDFTPWTLDVRLQTPDSRLQTIMIILSRLYWFINWAVIAVIVSVIVLVLLRLIANQADLNPFGWSSLTIRRLTDPFIGPVRRALVSLGVDPKYAPLVTILLAVLLGWF